MNAKGISPLIATVLLISFTIAAATIVFGWGTDFINMIKNPASERGQRQSQCVYATMKVGKTDVAYNFSGASSSVNITISNNGNEPLYNFSFAIITDKDVYTFSPTNQYNESAPMAKSTTVLFKTVNISSAPAGTEIFSKLRITALCRKTYTVSYEIDMT